ncbi:hypothetical protein SAMN06295970_108100 [Noviherbaspirillum suwonense]|uniref:Uracil-DNA glycosylase-like domain-containing protein n=1 Tax=Noviherbaspirillum suwonense TaxID=1224511 RepID=A0ABY1Q885_9BURK|nr:hypothetical protein SAMN06295970_108100 [Noviherbaspirillum suwonense]
MRDIWIGENYLSAERSVLVLGESWYGETQDLPEFIRGWASRKVRDMSFSKIFNTGSGMHTTKSTPEDRLRFWNQIAFYNFVPGSIAEGRESRSKNEHFEAACEPFKSVLKQIEPHGVWILGIGQAKYSQPIVEAAGIAHEVAPYPTTRGLTREVLQSSWHALMGQIR